MQGCCAGVHDEKRKICVGPLKLSSFEHVYVIFTPGLFSEYLRFVWVLNPPHVLCFLELGLKYSWELSGRLRNMFFHEATYLFISSTLLHKVGDVAWPSLASQTVIFDHCPFQTAGQILSVPFFKSDSFFSWILNSTFFCWVIKIRWCIQLLNI